jgi:hypothetical protein
VFEKDVHLHLRARPILFPNAYMQMQGRVAFLLKTTYMRVEKDGSISMQLGFC